MSSFAFWVEVSDIYQIGIYTDKDELLYSLDSGLLAHYNRDYEESNSKLSNAERLIESYYSKSISQGINSFFTNDNEPEIKLPTSAGSW